jgi:hypothetical protein
VILLHVGWVDGFDEALPLYRRIDMSSGFRTVSGNH